MNSAPSAPLTPDSQWVADSETTSHITFDPSLLHQSTEYTGSEQVLVGDSKTTPITETSFSTLSTNSSSMVLHNVQVVPMIAKNLISISRLTHDNPCSIEFFWWGFLVKDLLTRAPI